MSEHFIIPEVRVCTTCQVEKPINDFAKSSRLPTGRTTKCKGCSNEYNRKWRTHLYNKDQNLKKSFGIALSDYQRMHDAQDGKCAICDKEETTMRSGRLMKLSVDHNHTTGEIRALLCNNCNRGIGLLNDDILVLRSAVNYLEKHSD